MKVAVDIQLTKFWLREPSLEFGFLVDIRAQIQAHGRLRGAVLALHGAKIQAGQ
jgi:hypothetical protein